MFRGLVPTLTTALSRPATLRVWGVTGVVLAGAGVLSLSLMTAGADTTSAADRTRGLTVAPSSSSTTPSAPGSSSAPTTSRPASSASATPPADNRVVTALAANGIPTVALTAYRRAAARLGDADPSCGIPWYLVAAIGKVESDHGRFGGATLYANGDSIPHIVGIPLDGSRSATIRDTDGGQLDGDTVYDRAVGPMQFIPSTWASYAVDGNGDGVRDPFNIDDAALATAHYLCVAGGNLRTAAGVQAAVLAYNHSAQYLATVIALARAYGSGIPVSGPIGGPTTGALPPVAPGPQPPANPGPPPVLINGVGSTTSGGSSGGSSSGSTSTGSRGGAGGGGRTSTRPTSPHPTTARPSTTRPTTPRLTPTPTPTRTTTKPAPTTPTTPKAPLPTSSTCHLNVLGICVP